MKFLLDVNASGALRELLVTLGYDVACVSDIDSRMSDSNILHWAVKESRIIITTDSDFEQIIWQQERLHNGVLRLENLPRNQRIELFIAFSKENHLRMLIPLIYQRVSLLLFINLSHL